MKSFTVMPMAQEISLGPGEVYQGTIKVAAPKDVTEAFLYKVEIMPYSVVGTQYTADFTTTNDHTLMSDWIKIENPTGEVAPNETDVVNFTITVPETAPAGGQYVTIVVGEDEARTNNGSTNIQNALQMASIIYADVTGETVHEGEILKNEVPGFTTDGVITVSATVENKGNVHEKAVSTLKVQNKITGEMIYPDDGESGSYVEMVMPETTRTFSRVINDLPKLGVFEVTQDVSYLGETSQISTTLVACPIWFMVLAFAMIATIISTIVWMILRHKKRMSID